MAKAVIRKPKKKVCQFCKEKATGVDYKDATLLRKFISDRGKIRARRVTGNCVQHQRDVAIARQERARGRSAALHLHRSLRRIDMATKIILQQEVTGLGSAGDVVEVKDGYARNYLDPAWRRHPSGAAAHESQADSIRKAARSARSVRDEAHAAEIKGKLEARGQREGSLRQGRRLYGAVTAADIAAAVSETTTGESDRQAHHRAGQPDQGARCSRCIRPGSTTRVAALLRPQRVSPLEFLGIQPRPPPPPGRRACSLSPRRSGTVWPQTSLRSLRPVIL